MRARAPASSANLGPGFDTLAVALALYVEVEVTDSDELTITSEGEGSELPADAGHLAARVATAAAGHDRLAISIRSDIPVGRGLGSSAALAVAAAAAAGAADPLLLAAEVDGHPENAAASAVGGLVTATMVEGRPVVHQLGLDHELAFVVVVPDRALATEKARMALPDQVPFADACFNLGRMGLLIAGLADHRLLIPAAMSDRLHQTPRSALFPQAPGLLAALVDAGALASCWSGAGPSLLALCLDQTADEVADAARKLLVAGGLPGTVLRLHPDYQGAILLEA